MSVKLIAAAIVIAGGIGAVASYFQHNPGTMQALWRQTTTFQGPLAAIDTKKDAKPYRRSVFYKMCERGFARKLQKHSQSARGKACTCMDKEISAWSRKRQDRAIVAFAQIAYDYGFDPDRSRRSRTSTGRLSQHERNVRESRARHKQRELQREVASYAERFKKVDKISMNPVTLLWVVGSLESVASRCGIMAPPPNSLKDVGKQFEKIGQRH